jgi:uncharacterized membrane protein required for colicin V production
MNWLDVLVVVIIVGAAVAETIRGFGRAIFDALALYGMLWVAATFAAPLCPFLRISNQHNMNVAFAYCLLAGAGALIALGLARFAYSTTIPNAGMFDRLLGLVVGIGVGVMLAHGLVRGVTLSSQAGVGPAVVSAGGVASEIFDFHSYHAIMDSLTGAVSYHRELNPWGG